MCAHLVAVTDRTGPGGRIADVAAELARLLAVGVRTVPATAGAGEILARLAEPAAQACVLESAGAEDERGWEVAAGAAKPVLLVPPHADHLRPHVKRALLPLDGSAESAAAVGPAVQLLDDAGVELVLLHVFEPATAPRFWDQRAHAEREWSNEFTSRSGAPPHVRLALRRGRAGVSVVEAAEDEAADLIALGWSQATAAGRARTVRAAVADARVPVLLVPVHLAA